MNKEISDAKHIDLQLMAKLLNDCSYSFMVWDPDCKTFKSLDTNGFTVNGDGIQITVEEWYEDHPINKKGELR